MGRNARARRGVDTDSLDPDRAAGPAALTVRGAEGDRTAIARAVEAAQSFGVPVAHPVRPVDLAFAGAASMPDTPPVTPWIASAAIALHRSALLAETGAPVRVGERDGVMTIATTLAAGSAFAPAVIRAALLAASPATIDREAETASVDERVLARWRRAPAPDTGATPPADDNDGRWLWALALVLLIVESAVRRGHAAARAPEARSLRASGDTHADAA
jgi:hypothetical protein